jgi:hypothetical protein
LAERVASNATGFYPLPFPYLTERDAVRLDDQKRLPVEAACKANAMPKKLAVTILAVAVIGAAFLIWRLLTTPIFEGEVVTAGCHRDATGAERCPPPFKPK